MEKKEIILYAFTAISFLLFIFVVFSAVSKSQQLSPQKFTGLTGNIILNSSTDYRIGDKLTGEIKLNSDEKEAFGILLLNKDSKSLITETFNLSIIVRENQNKENFIRLEDITDYTFEDSGNYELFIYLSDLDLSIKKSFIVNR